jgi:hypothetical protein
MTVEDIEFGIEAFPPEMKIFRLRIAGTNMN